MPGGRPAGCCQRVPSPRRVRLWSRRCWRSIRWGLSFGPENRAGDHHRNDWDLLALKALFRPERAPDVCATAQFELTGWARIEEGRMSVGVGAARSPDLEISGTVPDLFMSSEHPQDLLRSGNPELLRRFMAAFALRHRSGHLLVW